MRPRGMLAVAAAIASCAVVLASCALVLERDYSEFDAGQPADVFRADTSGVPSDAAAGDAPTPGFCEALSPAPMLCNDFDTDSWDLQWTETTMTGGGVVTRDFSEWRSAPASLRAMTLPDGSDNER